jgi:hypothetical protein
MTIMAMSMNRPPTPERPQLQQLGSIVAPGEPLGESFCARALPPMRAHGDCERFLHCCNIPRGQHASR